MKLRYYDKTYTCDSVEKKQNQIIIHTGEFSEDGEETIYYIFGDIDFDAVELVGGTWSENRTNEERIAELEEALEMLLNGVTE